MNSTDDFETIVSEHYEALFKFAMSLTRSEFDAWDLTQQTFYIWATKGHQLRDRSKVKTWLFTTLHRAFLAVRRGQGRFIHHDLDDVAEELPTVSPMGFDQVDSVQVLSALARVDQVYQSAVALFYLEDCSQKDVAAILDLPMGTVKSRISRGIAQLKKILSSDEFSDSPASAVGDGSVALTEIKHSHRRHDDGLSAGVSERGYTEWDLSTAIPGEPFGVL